MKKIVDRLFVILLMGFIIQLPFITAILLLTFIWQIFDTFYNLLIVQWILGKQIPWLGFIISMVIAFVLGLLAETRRGWTFLGGILSKIKFTRFVTNTVEQWKTFRKLARSRGVILAPYYRDRSSFSPGVVTSILPVDDGSHLITVVFGDIPIPKPFLLQDTDIIFTHLTFGEAITYILSMGLAFKMFSRKLKRQTPGEYIRREPQLLGKNSSPKGVPQ